MKLDCQEQELRRSKINDFLVRILNGIELSGRELQGPKVNDFLERINKSIELAGAGAPEVLSQCFA